MFFIRKILLLLLCASIISCSKNKTVVLPEDPMTFSEIFDAFWFGMNKNYVFWDIEKVKWDEVYLKYRPIFDSLHRSNSSDEQMAFKLIKSITDSLSDGHFSIKFKTAILKDSVVYPSYYKIKKRGPLQVFYLKTDTTYLDSGYQYATDNNFSFGGVPLSVVCGTINKNILYFSCSSFNLFKSYEASIPSPVKPVIEHFFYQMVNDANLKGIIIDVRNNQGGDLNDLNFLVGRFINSPLQFGYTRYKTGNGTLDFSPWIESFVNPGLVKPPLNQTKIILTDRYSASLSEIITMAMRVLPKSYVVGDTSWGATGALVAKDIYNSGQFTIGDFMEIKQSSTSFKYLDHQSYEGKGFPPDYVVIPMKTDIAIGIDKQLEKAISLIK